jgi:hypothetical protein
MPTMASLADEVVDHVTVNGLDSDFSLLIEQLRVEVGGHPNDIIPVLHRAGLPEVLLARADRLEQDGGCYREAERLRRKAVCFGPEYI